MEFGVFNGFFEEAVHYLPFLGLIDEGINSGGWGLPRSINKLKRIICENDAAKIFSGIAILLREKNWRMHLVAAMAALLLDDQMRQRVSEELWKAIHSGSWVSPQILVVLSKIDCRFEERGKTLLANDDVEIKAKRALEYLLFDRIDEDLRSDRGGTHAKEWEKDLQVLIEQGFLSFEEDALYRGPNFFTSYYERQIATCSNTYWIRRLTKQMSSHPYWLQRISDRVSPNAIHFLHAAEHSRRWGKLKSQEIVTPQQYEALLKEIESEFDRGKRSCGPGIWTEEKMWEFKWKKDRWVRGKNYSVYRESIFPEFWFMYRYWGNDIGIRPATDMEIWQENPLFSRHRRRESMSLSLNDGRVQILRTGAIITALFLQWLIVEIKNLVRYFAREIASLIRRIGLGKVANVEYVDDKKEI